MCPAPSRGDDPFALPPPDARAPADTAGGHELSQASELSLELTAREAEPTLSLDPRWDPFKVSDPEPVHDAELSLEALPGFAPDEAAIPLSPLGAEVGQLPRGSHADDGASLADGLVLEEPSGASDRTSADPFLLDGPGPSGDRPEGTSSSTELALETSTAPRLELQKEPPRASAGDPRADPPGAAASLDLAGSPPPRLEPRRLPRPRPSTPPRGLLSSALSLLALVTLGVTPLVWRGVTRGWGPRAPAALEAVELRGGLYDAEGGTVLVVRGKVRAREAVSGAVRVKVDLLRRGQLLASQVGMAGSVAGPEEVYQAAAPPAAAALRHTLDEGASGSLGAGGTAPFLFVFPAPPPDLDQVELRVGVEKADARIGAVTP